MPFTGGLLSPFQPDFGNHDSLFFLSSRHLDFSSSCFSFECSFFSFTCGLFPKRARFSRLFSNQTKPAPISRSARIPKPTGIISVSFTKKFFTLNSNFKKHYTFPNRRKLKVTFFFLQDIFFFTHSHSHDDVYRSTCDSLLGSPDTELN